MSKLVKEFKEAAESAGNTVTNAFKGDVKSLLRLGTGGASSGTEGGLKATGKIIGNPFKVPDPLPSPGLGQSNTAEAAPDVDIAATESSRRRSGSAVGTRKLRVPLGGLR
jgi:hypothetical protein